MQPNQSNPYPSYPNQQGYPSQQYPQQYQAQQAPVQAQQLPGGPQYFGQPGPAQGSADPFADPSGGGGNAPHVRNLEGRTVIIVPKRVDESARFKDASRPTATFDLVVVDGGPGTYGENLDEHTGPTHAFTAPAYFRNAISGNDGIVGVVRDNPGSIVVGVIQRGDRGNRPWLLTKTHADLQGNDRPDGDARRAAARDLWFRVQGGEFPPTVPTLLAIHSNPAGSPPAGSVSYAQSSTVATQPQPAPPAPQYAQPMPTGPLPPPQGWDPQAWANFPPEAQQKIWAQLGAQQSAAPTQQHPGW